MRISTFQAAIGSASVLFTAQSASVSIGHRHAHVEYARRHAHGHNHDGRQVEGAANATEVVARKATCTLPDHPDLVYIPGQDNNGFALSPDQSCNDGDYCPIACVSGKVMAQWKPGTTYTYPESMYGGLYCNGGKAEKPFEDRPYCVDGTGAVNAVNKAGSIVSFCQTVLPGNEAMIIPTDVADTATLAVPGPDYWDGTAAHYYINPPGIPSSVGCVWGVITKALGNWTPYVAGANTMANGETFVKIAWNPEYLKTPLTKSIPTYGLKIECPDGGCNGLPCVIDPSKDGINGIESPVSTSGVGDANFCVVTVPKGKTANIVVFNTAGSSGGGGGDDSDSDDDDKDDGGDKPSPSPSPSPTPTPKPSSSSKPPEPPKTTSDSDVPTTTAAPSSSSAASTSTPSDSSSSSTSSEAFYGAMFHEQDVRGSTLSQETAPTTAPEPAKASASDAAKEPVSTTSKNEGAAAEGGSAIAGLVVALVAAAALL
ncbi:uncharacterized protein P884DRAFT_210782 [Thermothelomyces heterothallicus CBS 202.75]|uniref:uncharacterized protein n=1 Tax=Thermothelomyces heterothallicus CBS 202.75 TaxID=1149848 RepID=UPI003743AFDD